jgi:hypothetical protein
MVEYVWHASRAGRPQHRQRREVSQSRLTPDSPKTKVLDHRLLRQLTAALNLT